jgi:hypothetical protein
MFQERPHNLDDALKQFSLCLEDPCIPGELEEWARAVWDALTAMEPILRNHVTVNHQDQFSRITEEDAEMFRHVTLLRQQDRNILQHFESLAELTRKLLERAPRIEPNEAQVDQAVSALITGGLAFVVQVERQEIAIRTWFQEAFLRERGVAD